MAKHAKLGASSAHRWMACPGSVALCEKVPNYSSPAADEGTDAHQLAEICLKSDTDANEHIDEVMEKGNVVDEDMADAVQLYLNTVRDDLKPGDELMIEHKFNLAKLHPDMFGTNDACIYQRDEKLLRVYDYKHGAGTAVEVDNNPQLLYYALGAAMAETRPLSEIELVIVQPRCPHPDGSVRRWRTDLMDLIDWSSDLLEAANRTKDPDAPLSTGEHCKFCAAAAICPKAYEEAINMAQEDFAPLHDDTLQYDPKELADKLAKLDVIEQFCKNVRKFAYHEAVHGRTVPGFKLVEKQARRKFKSDVTVDVLCTTFPYLDEDDVSETSIKAMGTVEKTIKAQFPGRKKEISARRQAEIDKFNTLCVKESSGYTLVTEDDKREAVTVGPEQDFEVIEGAA